MSVILDTLDITSRGTPSSSSFILNMRPDLTLYDETRPVYGKVVMFSYQSNPVYPLDVRPVVQCSLVGGVLVSDGSRRQILFRSPITTTLAGERVYVYNTDMVVKLSPSVLNAGQISFELDRSDGGGLYVTPDYCDMILQIFQ